MTQLEKWYPDWARRASDAYNLHLWAEGAAAWNRWVAIRLSDGSSDGTLYDTKGDAIRHQLHEQLCAYAVVMPTGMSPAQAFRFLTFYRQLHDGGMRLQNNHDQAAPARHILVPPTYSGGKLR